jgi:hypothetical protein
MRVIAYHLFFIIILFTATGALAQGHYTISGIVTSEKGEPLKSATVFISGTQKMTATNDEGKFTLVDVSSGNFQVSVQMLGYFPSSQNVVLKDRSARVNLSLTERSLPLNEVVIGDNSNWAKYFMIFKEKFLGTTDNAKSCLIVNPKAIQFSTRNGILSADVDEFLIIENKRLGYRIRYQLKYFSYNTRTVATGYDGNSYFEELAGTDKMKSKWMANRLAAYKGSLMHFLRSVYWNSTLKEGFFASQLYGDTIKTDRYNDEYVKVLVDTRPVGFDTLVNVIDTSFVSFKFTHLYVTYQPQTLLATLFNADAHKRTSFKLTDKGSTVKLYLNEAVIDRRGSYKDYRTFLLRGLWSKKRVGDQLPFEYRPD